MLFVATRLDGFDFFFALNKRSFAHSSNPSTMGKKDLPVIAIRVAKTTTSFVRVALVVVVVVVKEAAARRLF